jgi:hypothetical protein
VITSRHMLVNMGFWTSSFQIVDSRDLICLPNMSEKYVGEVSENK